MSLLGILFVVVFASLLIKAIIETVWGILLIGHGIVCHTLAAILNLIAMVIRLMRKSRKKSAIKHHTDYSDECMLRYYRDCPESMRILASFRRPAKTQKAPAC